MRLSELTHQEAARLGIGWTPEMEGDAQRQDELHFHPRSISEFEGKKASARVYEASFD